MAKKDLKEHLSQLTKKQLQAELMDLYDRFKEIKTFYDFSFNPKEDKLLQDAKAKIYQEYFPLRRKRARMRRSVAQKLIKHFITLEMSPDLISDLMLYNIEIAQLYQSENMVNVASFYKSIYNSFKEAVTFIIEKGLDPKTNTSQFYDRAEKIVQYSKINNWENYFDMEDVYLMLK